MSDVYARVNGKTITKQDVDRETENLLQHFQGRIPQEDMPEVEAHLRKQAGQNLVNQLLLLGEARREGIQPSAEAVEKKLAEIMESYPSPEVFHDQLKAMGACDEQVRKEIANNLKIQTLLDRELSKLEAVTDADVETYHKEHPERFEVPERFRASHILVSVDPDADDQIRADKRLLLSGLKAKLDQGADFAHLARQHSDCPSKAKGGDLGLFERGKMVAPFEDAASRLEIGETSDIVETQFGYHLIRLLERKEAGTVELDTVREKVSSMLNLDRETKMLEAYVETLAEKAEIEFAG